MSSVASLYVHVPFCAGKCDYCDFYSVPVKQNDKRITAYIDKVQQDAEFIINEFKIKQIPSVYIGGGTPSMLGTAVIEKLLDGLRSNSTEITLEANPESCDEDFLLAVKDSGVNRISLGVQTFNEASRLAVKRLGQGLPQKLENVSEIFGHDFSVDLMSGLPFQDESVLLADIEKVIALEPGHISLYALTVDAETPLGLNVSNSKVKLPTKDEADNYWLAGRDALEKAGYAQYEVSNFCKPGKESLHNLRYWRMENWLGIGPSASGTIINDDTGQRFTNIADIDIWLDRKPEKPFNAGKYFSTIETLDRITLIKETLLMGFRLTNGPDNYLFQQRFGKTIEEIIPNTIKSWRLRGLFCEDKTSLTKQGLLLLNTFLVDAFEEVVSS